MSVEVGAKLPGKVSGITNFGAFIDLGSGKTGLVHISEVSNTYVNDINDVLKVGDEVKVKVMSIGDDGKVSLSIKRASDERPQAPKKEFRPKKDFSKNYEGKPAGKGPSKGRFQGGSTQNTAAKSNDFDTLMSSFLKDSDDRLTSLKRNTEGKRGGRGGRRN